MQLLAKLKKSVHEAQSLLKFSKIYGGYKTHQNLNLKTPKNNYGELLEQNPVVLDKDSQYRRIRTLETEFDVK